MAKPDSTCCCLPGWGSCRPAWQQETLAALVLILPALLSDCSGAAARGELGVQDCCVSHGCQHLVVPPSTAVCLGGCPAT